MTTGPIQIGLLGFFSSSLPVIAQAVNSEWTSVVVLLTNIGFSAVVAWYLLSRAIPSIQDKFSKDLASQREIHDQLYVREREAFEKVISLVMDQRIADVRSLAERVDHLSIKQDRLCELLEDVVNRLKTRTKS